MSAMPSTFAKNSCNPVVGARSSIPKHHHRQTESASMAHGIDLPMAPAESLERRVWPPLQRRDSIERTTDPRVDFSHGPRGHRRAGRAPDRRVPRRGISDLFSLRRRLRARAERCRRPRCTIHLRLPRARRSIDLGPLQRPALTSIRESRSLPSCPSSPRG